MGSSRPRQRGGRWVQRFDGGAAWFAMVALVVPPPAVADLLEAFILIRQCRREG
jgi:hypothetical protein